MNRSTRACVAYVAGRLISGKPATSIYDYSQSKHVSISGTVNGKNVNLFDNDRGCHIEGSPGGDSSDMLNLFDGGGSHCVELSIRKNMFGGYDYGDAHHFRGEMKGNSIEIYDFLDSTSFNFIL